MIGWLMVAALAADPVIADPAEAASAEVSDEVSEEVIVIGEQQVRAARDEVVRTLEAEGWGSRRKRDGRVVFRGPEPWMGRALLSPGGDLEFVIPAMAWQGLDPQEDGYSTSADDHGYRTPTATGSFQIAPEAKKVRAVHDHIRALSAPQVRRYQDLVRQRAFSRKLMGLPDQLDALWSRGVPLAGVDKIEGAGARRAAVLDYWATRAETAEGARMMKEVARWLRGVVQDSDTPITPAEAAEAEARRTDGRTLGLF